MSGVILATRTADGSRSGGRAHPLRLGCGGWWGGTIVEAREKL